MKSVFDDTDGMPELPIPMFVPSMPLTVDEPHSALSNRPRLSNQVRGSFEDIVDFKLNLDDQDLEARKLSVALEKWYLIFRSGRNAWPRNFDLDHMVSDSQV